MRIVLTLVLVCAVVLIAADLSQLGMPVALN